MQRFLDVFKHFDPMIVWKRGKSNHLADWLSRPPSDVSAFPITGYDPAHDCAPNFIRKRTSPEPERLNWIDLQAIGEYLQHSIELPKCLPLEWVKENFAVHKNSTYRVLNGIFLKILHYGELVNELKNINDRNAHCSNGTLIRESRQRLWHPDLILVAQEAFKTCPRC